MLSAVLAGILYSVNEYVPYPCVALPVCTAILAVGIFYTAVLISSGLRQKRMRYSGIGVSAELKSPIITRAGNSSLQCRLSSPLNTHSCKGSDYHIPARPISRIARPNVRISREAGSCKMVQAKSLQMFVRGIRPRMMVYNHSHCNGAKLI